MAAPLLTVAFDPASLGAIQNLPGFITYLNDEMSQTLNDVGELLAQAMTTNTWMVFAMPEGFLADAIQPYLANPLELIISVDVPYAWRMERGFGPDGTAQADSLGRIYTNPAKPYAQPALDDNADQIQQMMNFAVGRAIADYTQKYGSDILA